MNSYITLGTKYYSTSAQWEPTIDKAMSYKVAFDGTIVATYAPAEILTYSGEIRVPAGTPASGYGSASDLETTLSTRGGITFIDHEGNTRTAHVKGWRRSSLTRKWDSPSNKFFYEVTLVCKR